MKREVGETGAVDLDALEQDSVGQFVVLCVTSRGEQRTSAARETQLTVQNELDKVLSNILDERNDSIIREYIACAIGLASALLSLHRVLKTHPD